MTTMDKTHSCGELRIEDVGQTVTLVGWVHDSITLGNVTFVDLRDNSGITQLIVDTNDAAEIVETANSYGKDWIQVTGEVVQRQNKNPEMSTGEIWVRVCDFKVFKTNGLINMRVIRWTYENFGLVATLKRIGVSLVAFLAFVGYCLTLPFQFFWILWRQIRKGKL